MGDLRDPLLRPARPARGVRPAACRRGPPASGLARAAGPLALALALSLAITALTPGVALADTLTLPQYQQRLDQVRRTLTNARASGGQVRAVLIADAQSTVRTTHQVALPSGDTLAVDDSALALGIETSDASLDAAIARVSAHILLVSRIGSPAIDAATADAQLRQIVEQQSAASGSANPDLFDALGRLILRFVSGLRGPGIGFAQLWPFIGTLGIAVILFILATLGRGLPERVRREVLVRGGPAEERVDPAMHLRVADAALTSARPRDAIHALFLYAITALAARETIRYDPALTDSELLVRAAAIPHADALRDLVGIYERSWFGLRDPSVDEARRARELALRVAP